MNDYYLNYFGRILLLNSLKTKPLHSCLFGWIWVSLSVFPHSLTYVEKLGVPHICIEHSISWDIKSVCLWESEFMHAAVCERTWFKSTIGKDQKELQAMGENWLWSGGVSLNMNWWKLMSICSCFPGYWQLLDPDSLAFLGGQAGGRWFIWQIPYQVLILSSSSHFNTGIHGSSGLRNLFSGCQISLAVDVYAQAGSVVLISVHRSCLTSSGQSIDPGRVRHTWGHEATERAQVTRVIQRWGSCAFSKDQPVELSCGHFWRTLPQQRTASPRTLLQNRGANWSLWLRLCYIVLIR